MYLIALKMLIGDRAKYLGLVFGITFATVLMSQQLSMFVGLLGRTASQIRDVSEADVWVMDPQMQYIDEIKALPDKALGLVRGVEGVKWAVPFFKGMAIVRTGTGRMQQAIIMGVDDATLIGRCPNMLLGQWSDLKQPDAMVIDKAGFEFIWPKEKPQIGRTVEINDQRVAIVGVCQASPPFTTFPVMYSRYTQAIRIVPGERNRMSFVIVKGQEGQDPKELAARIQAKTGLQALSSSDFEWRSIRYYLTRTGIPINFGITVTLGFIVGAAVAAQTFYIFVIENLKQFGALKAIGVTNQQILRMVLLQAALVGTVGYGIGSGLCTLFFIATSGVTALRGFYVPFTIMGGTAIAVALIMLLASLVSIRKVFVIDPAIVFRG